MSDECQEASLVEQVEEMVTELSCADRVSVHRKNALGEFDTLNAPAPVAHALVREILALRAERNEADRLAGEAERRRKYEEDELRRLRCWSELVKEAIGLRFNDSLDDVIPEIERALSALKETSDE